MQHNSSFSVFETNIQAITDSVFMPGSPLLVCDFCGKLATNDSVILEKLSGPNHFYCEFCLRQRHNTKMGRNVLALSFRGLIAYLYYEIYLAHKAISFSEIEDMIADHVFVGLKNPTFSYDVDTMLWYLDFTRIGSTKKKLPVEHVKNTVLTIMKVLRLPNFIPGVQLPMLELKYVKAVDEFYQKRARPKGRKLLIPTMKGCGSLEPKGQSWDKHKDFVSNNMLVKLC